MSTLKKINFGKVENKGYMPMYERTQLTDRLQSLTGIEVNKQIIVTSKMNGYYRIVKKS